MTRSDVLRNAVAYARLAPSVHNTQPWRFALGDDVLTLSADPSRRLDVLDPTARQLVVSCGAALANLDLAVRAAGARPAVRLLPDEPFFHRLATVDVAGPYEPTGLERMLFEAIPRRATNRLPLDSTGMSAEVLSAVQRLARDQRVGMRVVDQVATQVALATLTTVADRRQSASTPFRDELRRWSRPGEDAADGIPFHARGLGAIGTRRLTVAVRDFDVDGRAARAAAVPEPGADRPVLLLLWTSGDRPADWLRTGLALQRILLALTAAGFAASFVNQAIDDPDLRPRVRDEAGVDGYPQLLLRAGAGVPVMPTPRRPVEHVLLGS